MHLKSAFEKRRRLRINLACASKDKILVKTHSSETFSEIHENLKG